MRPKDDGEVRGTASMGTASMEVEASEGRKQAETEAVSDALVEGEAKAAAEAEAAKKAQAEAAGDSADVKRRADEQEAPCETKASSRSPASPSFDLREQSVLVAVPQDGSDVEPDDADDADLSSFGKAMRRLGPRLLGFVLVLVVGAGGVGTVLTLVNPFRDWFMHLAMYAVLLSFFLLYLKAHGRRRSITRYVMMIVTSALCGFFAWILVDYVPAQKVSLAHRVVAREEMPLLYVPIGLLLGVILFLLFHCVVAARYAHREPEQDTPSRRAPE